MPEIITYSLPFVLLFFTLYLIARQARKHQLQKLEMERRIAANNLCVFLIKIGLTDYTTIKQIKQQEELYELLKGYPFYFGHRK